MLDVACIVGKGGYRLVLQVNEEIGYLHNLLVTVQDSDGATGCLTSLSDSRASPLNTAPPETS